MNKIILLLLMIISVNAYSQNIYHNILDPNQKNTKQYIAISWNDKGLLSNNKIPHNAYQNKGHYAGFLLTDFADSLASYFNRNSLIDFEEGGFFVPSTAGGNTTQNGNGHDFTFSGLQDFSLTGGRYYTFNSSNGQISFYANGALGNHSLSLGNGIVQLRYETEFSDNEAYLRFNDNGFHMDQMYGKYLFDVDPETVPTFTFDYSGDDWGLVYRQSDHRIYRAKPAQNILTDDINASGNGDRNSSLDGILNLNLGGFNTNTANGQQLTNAPTGSAGQVLALYSGNASIYSYDVDGGTFSTNISADAINGVKLSNHEGKYKFDIVDNPGTLLPPFNNDVKNKLLAMDTITGDWVRTSMLSSNMYDDGHGTYQTSINLLPQQIRLHLPPNSGEINFDYSNGGGLPEQVDPRLANLLSLCVNVDDSDRPIVMSKLFVASTYTPTILNGNNISSASSNGAAQYVSVKNKIYTISGSLLIDPTSTSTLTIVLISLPTSAALGSNSDLAGTAASVGANAFAEISGFNQAGSGYAYLEFNTNTIVTNQRWSYQFTYKAP